MPDFILIDGDKAVFMPTFGLAIVIVRPGDLKASGPATHKGKKLAVDGDEKKVEVPGCMYTAGPYAIPGVGTLKINALAGDQKAKKTNTGGKAVLLKGSLFIAKFEVQTPAQIPPPASVSDATPQYPGQGQFVTTNVMYKGS
jgi:hypothetical protein